MELDTEYDLIVLGTGFVESVLAGAVARSGKKVLHLDYNDYYGGYASSNTLSGFEKVLTSTPEAINAQPDTWPSQTYTCIPAATNPAPKFSNVKVYSYDPPKTTETTETSTEATSAGGAKETTEKTEQSVDVQTEGKKDTEAEEKKDQETEQKKGIEEEEKTQEESNNNNNNNESSIKKEEHPRSGFEGREKLMASSRQFSIDIIPRLMFSRGEMVQLLISSSVGRYLEFKCFERTYLLTNDSVQPVPCSKGDIFKSKYITNSERFKLTRFMQLIHNDLTENGKIDPNAFSSFYDFIKSQNLSPNLEMFVLYAISMCTADQQSSANKVSAAEGLRILETYVSSVSKYGNTPFLCPMYGVSELPQAFCRLCAVYAGVYVLRRSAQCLLVDSQTNQFKGIICSEGQMMKASHFVSTGSYFPQLLGANPNISRSSRCVVISSSPIVGEGEGESEGQSTLLVIPPLSPHHAIHNPHAIHVLQFDQSLSVAPKGKYVLHFSTEASGTAEEDLQRAVSYFLNVPQMADSELVSSKPYAQWIAYFNLNLHTPSSPTNPSYPPQVFLVSEGPSETTTVDFTHQLQEAKEVFSSLSPPPLLFLPKVPNPEDIIWVGSNEETAQGEGEATKNGNGEEDEKRTKGEGKERKEENAGDEKEEEGGQRKQENAGDEKKEDEGTTNE